MNKEIIARLNQLPDNIRDNSLSDQSSDAILLVWKQYLNDDKEKLEKFKDVVGLTFLKDAKVEQLSLILKEAFQFDEKTAAEVALVILCKMLYPVKDFYPGVEDEILKLGGEIPKEIKVEKVAQQFANREEAIEDMLDKERAEIVEKTKDKIVYGKIEDLIRQHPELGDEVIGAQNSIDLKGMSGMKPMIKYWIQDYKDKVGIYNDHSNLDRVQYVCHDKNTRSMNDEERRQLNLIVKSFDGDIDLPYSPKLKKIDFSLIQDE
ncbi:MAG: hypothetical protein PHX30_02615 [Candidatus Pacebacteria bacterium]|nr:hypothetical protein [Candidatus Paceibacterota bacterium]